MESTEQSVEEMMASQGFRSSIENAVGAIEERDFVSAREWCDIAGRMNRLWAVASGKVLMDGSPVF